MYVREKAVKEVEVTLAVKDHHRYVVTVFGRSDTPAQVLRNDVPQKCRLADPVIRTQFLASPGPCRATATVFHARRNPAPPAF